MRRARHRILKIAAIVVLLGGILLFGISKLMHSNGNLIQWLLSFGHDSSGLKGPYEVLYVIDGDTFVANLDGTEATIRLIGVDAPESVNTVNPERNCEEGKIASKYTSDLLDGKQIWIEEDIETQDPYGRHLAYVYLDSNGKDMLQNHLLGDGMAITTIRRGSPHCRVASPRCIHIGTNPVTSVIVRNRLLLPLFDAKNALDMYSISNACMLKYSYRNTLYE